jgi:preprotein translocase subunit SecB
MSDTTETAAQPQPSLKILAQYVRDLSFENPNAPHSLAGNPPEIAVGVNVQAKSLAENDYEVELKLEAKAERDGKTVFLIELAYAGVFHIENVPANVLQPILLIECPRQLFPFARQIMANASQQGGFMPLMLEPLDFGVIYQRRMQQAANATASGNA